MDCQISTTFIPVIPVNRIANQEIVMQRPFYEVNMCLTVISLCSFIFRSIHVTIQPKLGLSRLLVPELLYIGIGV